MKVFLRYEDNDDNSLHKTLKITLPKSWISGPTSRLLEQFVESYNAGGEGAQNPLTADNLHLSVRRPSNGGDGAASSTMLNDLPSDGVVVETISDREDVYICHGPSRTLGEINAERLAIADKKKKEDEQLSKCVHFGCNQRFPKGGPYPNCKYHSGPPVFHETAKFWSCCPNKKAFDWDEFQSLPACQSGICTDIKDEGGERQKQFLGGCDIREKMNGPKLRSIEDFNTSAAAGGSEGAPILERLRSVLEELGVENELFEQVVNGIQKDVMHSFSESTVGENEAVIMDESIKILGGKIKSALKAVAAEQLRIRYDIGNWYDIKMMAPCQYPSRGRNKLSLMKSFTVSILLFSLIILGALIRAAAQDVDGQCDSENSNGACDATDADVLSAPGGEERRVVTPTCEDRAAECAFWASEGECENNPNYMLVNCAISCNSCSQAYEMSIDDDIALKAVEKYGKPQKVEGMDGRKTLEVIHRTISYMENDIYGQSATHSLSETILAECANQEELCAFWAAIGECEANKAYMKTKCAPSCQTCDMIDMNIRCPPLGEDVRPGLLPGELNAMFERIVNTAPGNNTNVEIENGMMNYTVQVHSRPKPFEEGEEPISIFRDLAEPPWIITFDNFMSAEECEHLIKLGYESKYERSEDVGELRVDGSFGSVRSSKRTSENAWCTYKKGCRGDGVVQIIHERISKLTGIPANYSEDFQVLKYEPGQFYRAHHDYIGIQRDRRCGPRILTFFLYLSDVEGGATNFTDLDIAVQPKVGRALLWPSVLNSNPKDVDPRTHHEAQEVIKGTKFAANSWIHLHDYMAASEIGCT